MPTRRSTRAVRSRSPDGRYELDRRTHARLAALGGLRAGAPRPVSRARGVAARARRGDGAAQRPRPLHPARRGRLHLGGEGLRHRGLDARRARPVLRPGGRQDLPPPDVLRRARRRGAPLMDRPLLDYTLGLADDALVSAQRMGWWISRAPELEEDVALANIGLDQLGQARTLLSYAGELEGAGRSEDDLAYLRDDREFRNVKLVERPMADFGVAMARLLVLATYQSHLYAGLQSSSDETLAGIGAKAVKEVDYHVDHAAQWVLRLGDGTDESHARMQAALDAEWPYAAELFVAPPLLPVGVVDPTELREGVLADLARVIDQATLTVPEVPAALGGGREGLHTEHLGHLLAEMQHLHRSHPGAAW